MHAYNKILSGVASNNIKHKELIANASPYDTYNETVNHSNELIGIYDHDIDSPFWLTSDFEDDRWSIDLGTPNIKVIDWNEILLSDGSILTDIKNKKTLNFFKYLILSPNCPVTNGGSVKKIRSISSSTTDSIRLINIILSNDRLLNIGKSYDRLNSDFIFSALLKYCQGGFSHTINYNEKFNKFIKNLPEIAFEKVSLETFLEEYPYLSDNINILFKSKLEINNHINNAYKLYINGFYKRSWDKQGILDKPNYATVTNAIFGKSIIPLSSYNNIDTLSKYAIKPQKKRRQFEAINHYQDKGSISQSSVMALMNIVQHIPVSAQLAKINYLDVDPSLITLRRLKGLHDFKPVGRTFSLPPIFVLNSMEKAFNLTLSDKFSKDDLWYPDVVCENEPVLIIDLLYDTILKFSEETKGLKSNSSAYRKIVSQSLFISNKLRDLGFNHFIHVDEPDPVKVNSIVYYYKVLMGAIYVLTGTLNARRVDELTSLPPVGNLEPTNRNPWLEKISEEISDYKLRFCAAKTGIGGEISLRDYVERPTPLIIAKLIYKIENYNAIFIKKGLCSVENIALFNGVAFNNFKLHCLDTKQFNEAISCFCDYIETPTTVVDGVVYRYYILEHELRRFFSLLFFWSSGDAKIDSLRHQLAHSDLEHLYNYITESVTGDVLNSTKATYLAHKFRSLKSTDLEKLNAALLYQFGVDSINFKTIKEFMGLYFTDSQLDKDFKLNLDSELLVQQSKLEGQIKYLLDKDIITLEPEFFKNESNGSTFNFAIKVRDLDDEW